jgi:hypothetical protein
MVLARYNKNIFNEKQEKITVMLLSLNGKFEPRAQRFLGGVVKTQKKQECRIDLPNRWQVRIVQS